MARYSNSTFFFVCTPVVALSVFLCAAAVGEDIAHVAFVKIDDGVFPVRDSVAITNNATGVFGAPETIVGATAELNAFSAASGVTGGSVLDVAIDAAGQWHVVILKREERAGGLRTSIEYRNETGAARVVATGDTATNGTLVNNPALAIDGNGSAHVVYHEITFDNGQTRERILLTSNAGGVFGAPVTVADSSDGIRFVDDGGAPTLSHGAIADVAVDRDDAWHVAYLTRDVSAEGILMAVAYVSSASTMPVIIASGQETASFVDLVGNPAVAIGPGNVAHVAYARADTIGNSVVARVEYSNNELGGFASPETIVPASENLNAFRVNDALARGRVLSMEAGSDNAWHVAYLADAGSDQREVRYARLGGPPAVIAAEANGSGGTVANPALALEPVATEETPALVFRDVETEEVVAGAVTDGAAEVFIDAPVPGGTSPFNVVFTILETGAEPGLFENGAFMNLGPTVRLTAETIVEDAMGDAFARITYHAPLEFVRQGPGGAQDMDAIEREVAFRVTVNGNAFSPANGLTLARPPVALIHDQWDTAADWFDVLTALSVLTPFVHAHDYSGTASGGVGANLGVAGNAVDKALRWAGREGFAAEKADVVAHGAGGLLARAYVQDLGEPFYRGDVRKVITVGTPHSGTGWGDLIAASPFLRTMADDVVRGLTGDAEADAAGAVELATTSPLIDGLLNRPGLTARHFVPSHAVMVESALDNANSWERVLAEAAFFVLRDGLREELARSTEFLTGLLGDSHDLLVPAESQGGGLAAVATSLVAAPSHSAVVRDSSFDDLLQELLDAPAFGQGSPYDPAGFVQPPNISFDVTTLLPEQTERKGGDDAALTFIGPAQDSVVAPGAEVAVTLAVPQDTTEAIVFTEFGIEQLVEEPFETTLTIPQSATGDVRIVAVARAANGVLSGASTMVEVIPATRPVEVHALPPEFLALTTGESYALRVLGQYSDGVVRDVTASALGTGYSLTGIAASATANGIVDALMPGMATVTIRNVDRADVAVDVVPGEPPPPVKLSPALLDFGTVIVNTRRDEVFVLENPGDGPVEGAAVGGGFFQATFGRQYRIQPGDEHEVVIRFAPVAEGAFSEEITFTANGQTLRALAVGAAVPPPVEGEGEDEFPPPAVDCPGMAGTTGRGAKPFNDVLVLGFAMAAVTWLGMRRGRIYAP